MCFSILKLGLLVLLLGSGTGLVFGQAAKPIDAFFNPTTNETTVYLSRKYVPLTTYQPEGYMPPDGGSWIVKPEGLVLTVLFKTAGNKPTVPAEIMLSFESRSSGDFRFKTDRKLAIKADDFQLDLGQLTLAKSELDRSSRGMRGAYYEEKLEGKIKLEDYSRVVTAKRVQMSIGKVKFRVSDKNLKELRDYIQRLKS